MTDALAFFDAMHKAGAMRGESWASWRSATAALFGLPMTDAEADLFRRCTGRAELPSASFPESWWVCGRRSGKSFFMALCAVFLACFRDYRAHLGPGERATIAIIALDRRQARTVRRFVGGLLDVSPLDRLVLRRTAELVELKNRVVIEVHTASFRKTRGYSLAACLCDEVAYWRSEDSADPDDEIIASVMPALATIPGSMLIAASSPYRRKGVLWEAHQRSYAVEDPDVLVWKAVTRRMNPTVPQAVIDRALRRDPQRAAADYLCEWRSDIEGFISLEVVRSCMDRVRERAPEPATRYVGFVDPSGGSSDSMTVAIAHRQDDVVLIDAVREIVPPFSPDAAVREIAALCKSYQVSSVTGDKYGGLWPIERFKAHGIKYEPAALPKSTLYGELLPLLNAERVRLPDNAKLATQLVSLERTHGRLKDSIDHPRDAHDDLANAVAGVANLAGKPAPGKIRVGSFSGSVAGIGRISWRDADEPRPRTYSAYRDADGTVRLRRREGARAT
jgi:hypothetical protein